jgi:hypothetical protein
LAEFCDGFVAGAHAFEGLHAGGCEGAALDALGGPAVEVGGGVAGCAFFFYGQGDLGDGVGDYVEGVLERRLDLVEK